MSGTVGAMFAEEYDPVTVGVTVNQSLYDDEARLLP